MSVRADCRAMRQPDQSGTGNGSRKPNPSRDGQAMRVIKEYAAELRKIIRKLRRKLN